jgi:hypothetical protein
LAVLVGALAGAWRLDDAERVAEEAERVAADIDEPRSRAWALADVVGAWAGAGRLDDAERVAADIEPRSRARALAGLVGALAGAGRLDDAQRVAADIDDPQYRAEALTRIALKLSQTGDFMQAARIVAAVWTLGEWTTPLTALAEIRSSALVALGKAELSNRKS